MSAGLSIGPWSLGSLPGLDRAVPAGGELQCAAARVARLGGKSGNPGGGCRWTATDLVPLMPLGLFKVLVRWG